MYGDLHCQVWKGVHNGVCSGGFRTADLMMLSVLMLSDFVVCFASVCSINHISLVKCVAFVTQDSAV